MAHSQPNTDQAELARIKRLMTDPRYWRDQDPAIVAQVRRGFTALYDGQAPRPTSNQMRPAFTLHRTPAVADATRAANRREVDALLNSTQDGMFPTLHAQTMCGGGNVADYHDFLAQVSARDPARAEALHGKVLAEMTTRAAAPDLVHQAAAVVQGQGRNGDSLLAHISPQEAAHLKAHGGSGTRNPRTGLLEFFDVGDFATDFGEDGAGSDPDAAANASGMGSAEGGNAAEPTAKPKPVLQQKVAPRVLARPKPKPKPSLLALANPRAPKAPERSKPRADLNPAQTKASLNPELAGKLKAGRSLHSDYTYNSFGDVVPKSNMWAEDRPNSPDYRENAEVSLNEINEKIDRLDDERSNLITDISVKRGQLQDLRDGKSSIENRHVDKQLGTVASGLTKGKKGVYGIIPGVVSNAFKTKDVVANLNKAIASSKNEIEEMSQRMARVDDLLEEAAEYKGNLQSYLGR